MLSDRERRILARIERHLMESDPDLARLFAAKAARSGSSPVPTFMLVAGLALLVLGSVIAAVPIALAGMAMSLFALFAAHTRPSMIQRPDPA
ncbi:MAG: hypothetical protein QOF00_684 [Pseudonocardiales bacterium]|nr:hypothetical protein [Pseudonocardiales bacterium]